jgi:hypothetical protein
LAVRESGVYRFEVLSADVLPDDAALLSPDDGNVILGILLAVTTSSSEDEPVSTFGQLELQLADGTRATEVPPDPSIGPFKGGPLQPGETMKGVVLYEVPQDVLTGMTFEVLGGLGDEPASIKLDVSPR